MKYKLIFITVQLLIQFHLTAQTRYLADPSFENMNRWSSCNATGTPDQQPGSWDVSMPASDLNYYAGLVMRGKNNLGGPIKNEDVQTELLLPLLAGKHYILNIDLAISSEMDDGQGLDHDNPCYLRIIGSNSICGTTTVLATSPLITNYNWKTFKFDLHPTMDYKVLKFEIYHDPLQHSYLLLDNVHIESFLPENAGNILGSSKVCPDDSDIYYEIPLIPSATSYVWNYTGTGVTIKGSSESVLIDFDHYATSGILTVRGKNKNGLGESSANYEIKITDLPDKPGDIVGNEAICIDKNESSASYYVPEIANATSYSWSFSGDLSILYDQDNEAILTYSSSSTNGVLSVKGENECGFGDESSNIDISFKKCLANQYNICVPNAFTPNGDGINDLFFIEGLTENSQLKIFDRFGKMIYSTNNYENNWDGTTTDNKSLNSDTYWYVLKIPGIDMPYKGFVYLKN